MSLVGTIGLDAPGATVLAVGAHADDIEIGAGGTLLRIRRDHPRARLVWVVLSAADERAEEARLAAAAFGADEVLVADFPDRFFPSHWEEVKRHLAGVAADVGRADLVLTPWRHDRHQDHRLVGEVAWQVFRQEPIWAYEIAKYEADLASPNLLVSLDADAAGGKLDLLDTHFPSQQGHAWYDRRTFEGLMRIRGINANTEWAEGFHAEALVV